MALVRIKSDYDYEGHYQSSSIEEILQVERRLSDKKQLLGDIQNEYDLLEKQALDVYKSNVSYLILDQKGFIDACKDWLNMSKNKKDKDGNKLDGRKSYKEKDCYNYYIDVVKDNLGIDTMDDVSFIDYNFGQATEIDFSYLGHKWELRIPHINNLRLKDYRRYGASIFSLKICHMDSPNVWSCVGTTLDEEDLKKIMKQGIDKYVQVG